LLIKKISGTEFYDEFFQHGIRSWQLIIQKLFYITENFKLTEIDGFSSLISDLFLDCELFEADPLLKRGLSEEN
jgi:hypothetical protein